MDQLILVVVAIGMLTLPMIFLAALYYIVIYLIFYRKYKRNGGINNFEKFITRNKLDL